MSVSSASSSVSSSSATIFSSSSSNKEQRCFGPSPQRGIHFIQMRARAFLLGLSLGQGAPSPIPADEWALSYRNWSYFSDWIIPPSCVDPATCGAPPYVNRSTGFTDIFQVYSLSDPFASPPPSPRFRAAYTFYDGIGYQTALATSDDGVRFTQPLAPEGILYSPRATWPSREGDFDYGGAAFVGPLLTDYNVTAPRVLARVNGFSWYAYFAQRTRNALEPPPGATGLAFSRDGVTWERSADAPILDVNESRGAGAWEDVQVYAPFLLATPDGGLADFYNAKGSNEQSGIARLPGGAAALPGIGADGRSAWVRDAANPVVRNGNVFDEHMASDPKVFFDASLDGGAGAWVMLYFGFGGNQSHGAAICAAFSRDGAAWEKASSPLYLPGGHPRGHDRAHAHKAWLNVDASGRKFLYYTGDDGSGKRGLLLLTSTPL